MILVKGLSRIDSCRHRIHSSLSSSLLADNLKKTNISDVPQPQNIITGHPSLPQCKQTEHSIICCGVECGVVWCGPTCSIYGFPAQPSHCCQFYILWWFPPFLSRSQTQIAFRHDHPPPAREYSPGGWCPSERSQPCVGNSRDTGHSGQTSDASSFSNFRPGIEDMMSSFVISRSLGVRSPATSPLL